jgi:hypothetical protein
MGQSAAKQPQCSRLLQSNVIGLGIFDFILRIALARVAGKYHSVRAKTCSSLAKNCGHPDLAPW